MQVEVYEEYSETSGKNETRNDRRLNILPKDGLIESNGFFFKLTDSIEIKNEGDQDDNISWTVVDLNSEELVLQVTTDSNE